MSLKLTRTNALILFALILTVLFSLTLYLSQLGNALSYGSYFKKQYLVEIPSAFDDGIIVERSAADSNRSATDNKTANTADQSLAKNETSEFKNNAFKTTTFMATPNGRDAAQTFIEKPSLVAGGGMVIELNGAFRSAITIELDADSKHIHTICKPT